MNQEPMGGQNFQQPTNEPLASPQPGGWAPATEPAPAPTPPPPPPPASNPFETTPPPVPPVSGPMQPMGDQGTMEPGSRKSSWPLIIILLVLIIVGGLFLAFWMNWISLGGIKELWGGGKTETPAVEPTTEPTTPTANINDAKRKEDLANLKTALKKYYTATQSYPVAATMEKTTDPAALKVLVPDYLAALPLDPLSSTYYYGYKSDGTTFELTAVLEDKTDPSGITAGDIFLYRITDTTVETPTSSSSTTTTPTTNTNQ